MWWYHVVSFGVVYRQICKEAGFPTMGVIQGKMWKNHVASLFHHERCHLTSVCYDRYIYYVVPTLERLFQIFLPVDGHF